MKKTFSKQFKEFFEWYISLQHKKQLIILDILNKKKPDLLDDFTTDELQKLSTYVSDIPKVLAEIPDDKEVVVFFKKCGFDELLAKSIIEFGQEGSIFYKDVKLVKSLNKKQLEAVMDFIIKKMYIYEDYSETPFKDFVELSGLKDSDAARSVMGVLQNIIESVAGRKNSPEVLKNKMHKDYGFSLEQSDLVVSIINKYIAELQQAYLLQQINEVALKLSNLSCTSITETNE